MALRKLTPPPDRDRSHLILGYRQTSDGTWYLEWRRTAVSRKPVAIRKAWDTEIELISRIKALEARLAGPSAPRSVADLNLKPFDPTRYGRLKHNPTNPGSAPAPQLRPQAARELELQRPADAPAVGRPPHDEGADGGDGPRR